MSDSKDSDACRSLHAWGKAGLWARSPVLASSSWGGEGHGNGRRELRALADHLQSRSQFYHCLPHEAAEIQKGKSNSAPVTKR